MRHPEKHINSYIHTIISYIKHNSEPVSFTTITNKLNINLYQNPLLLSALKSNPKIKIHNDTLLFQPTYTIITKEDLLMVVRKNKCRSGILMSELLDSPSDIPSFVNMLLDENEIYVLKDIDGSQVVFCNNLNVRNADEDVRRLYREVKVPDYQEVKKELNLAGLKSGNEEKKRKAVVECKKKAKRFKRKAKLTNTHVKDLNFD
ncbi:hypothetical protein COBT_002119 [Conglomerata obtusa]